MERKPVFILFIEFFSLFYNFGVFLCLSSDDKESIAIWTELIVLLKCSLISPHDILISAECSY